MAVDSKTKKHYTHIYTGPTTAWGLRNNAKVNIIGKRAGGKLVRTIAGRAFLVGKEHLKPVGQ